MKRREFMKQCGGLCLGTLGIATVMDSCTANYYAVHNLDSNRLVIKKTEFLNPHSKSRKYILIRNVKLKFPVCIYRINENSFSALSMECTHNSCELNPHGDFLVCPCHGAEFDNLGKVQAPPAETDLLRYKITHDQENIYIHLP